MGRVESPTLLIVGGGDEAVLALNKKAMAKMGCITKLHIVPGATHLFKEPGALEEVATVAGEWLVQYLSHPPSNSRTEYRHSNLEA